MDDYNPNLTGVAQAPPSDPNTTRYFPPQEVEAMPSSEQSGPYGQEASTGVPPYQAGGQQRSPNASQTHTHTGHHHHERDRTMLGLILVGGGILFLLDQLNIFGITGNLVLPIIGGVFMYAYFTTRQGHRIGFLIPGAILLGIGVGQLISSLSVPQLWSRGDVTVLTLGLGFCLIWALERRHWWALIPGGILLMVGLSSLFAIAQLWPLALIALGIYLLYDQSRRHSPR